MSLKKSSQVKVSVPGHVCANPSVMLSPNATNRVADNCGGGGGGFGGAARTCTSKPQDAVRCLASSAVHVISVDPTGALLPLAGEHEEVTGVVPPLVVGAAYDSVTGFPSGEVTDWLAGQLIPNDDGRDGELHAVAVITRPAPRHMKTQRPLCPLCPPW